MRSTDGVTTSQVWGANGDIPVFGDFDGDGKTDIAIWRPNPSVWFVLRSSDNTGLTQDWGVSTDTPVNKQPHP
jgi:FG-GAP repeat protein